MRPSPSHPPDADARADRTRLWRSPALLALAAAVLIIAAAFLPALWQMWTQPRFVAAAGSHDAPWEADVTVDGALRVFGLRVPGSTLADAQSRWGEQLQVAVMVTRDGKASLEAFVETARPGGIAGRLLLTASVPPSRLAAWRERPAKEEQVSAQTRRMSLNALDLAQALQAPIMAVGFIPHAQLDAAIVRQRFGEPQRVLSANEHLEHWLYPRRGLAIALDTKGRELLQYVPPAEFDQRLLAPLLAAPAAETPVKSADSPASGPPG
ncbi:MAG: hypothetical protein JNJ71_09240 [Rubrivivax sp.]|nr:hypothetical protein [Rubrivivax sp.]